MQMENGSIQERQNQCIAYGDGEIYVKSPQNPVITGDMLPADCSKIDFRDPKVWKKGKNYYLIVGNKNSEQKGQVVLFPVKIWRNGNLRLCWQKIAQVRLELCGNADF